MPIIIRKFLLVFLLLMTLASCAVPEQTPPLILTANTNGSGNLEDPESGNLEDQGLVDNVEAPPPTATQSPTATATVTALSTADAITSQPTPTPVLVLQGPGQIVCPILLYHRIETPAFPNEYYVTPGNFRAQMQALKDWGYTPIPISVLIKAIREGALLPERPVVITFDDGDITVYTTAFPIMQEFGFVGVNYLVGNRINADGFIRPEHVRELVEAGWEVGSHSMTHANLAQSPDPIEEIYQSRLRLETDFGLPFETFAYPFGVKNDSILRTVSKHYLAAVGLGASFTQGDGNLYYLWRRSVNFDWDIETFGRYLPWDTVP